MNQQKNKLGDSLFLLEGKQDEPCTIILSQDGQVKMDTGELTLDYIIEALNQLMIKLEEEVENVRDNGD